MQASFLRSCLTQNKTLVWLSLANLSVHSSRLLNAKVINHQSISSTHEMHQIPKDPMRYYKHLQTHTSLQRLWDACHLYLEILLTSFDMNGYSGCHLVNICKLSNPKDSCLPPRLTFALLAVIARVRVLVNDAATSGGGTFLAKQCLKTFTAQKCMKAPNYSGATCCN